MNAVVIIASGILLLTECVTWVKLQWHTSAPFITLKPLLMIWPSCRMSFPLATLKTNSSNLKIKKYDHRNPGISEVISNEPALPAAHYIRKSQSPYFLWTMFSHIRAFEDPIDFSDPAAYRDYCSAIFFNYHAGRMVLYFGNIKCYLFKNIDFRVHLIQCNNHSQLPSCQLICSACSRIKISLALWLKSNHFKF